MYCLGVMDSGNYAYYMCEIFEKQGLIFEVVPTPCNIAKGGCGYCLKFPEEYMEQVISEGIKNNTPLREVYSVIPLTCTVKYKRII